MVRVPRTGTSRRGSRMRVPLAALAERRSHAPARCLGLFCVVLALSLLASAPALAISQRGHLFSFSYGSKGKGENEFKEPTGIAVNDATGDVYVVDHKNKRVVQLQPLLEAGKLVGLRWLRAWKVPSPSQVAVDDSGSGSDPSRGDVYVVGSSGKAIYKFSAEGAQIGKPLKLFETKEKCTKKEIEAKVCVKRKLEGIEAVALDAAGSLFVYEHAGVILTFTDAAANRGLLSMPTGLGASGEPGLALDSEDDVFVAHAPSASVPPVISKLEGLTGKLLISQLDAEDTTAVAVNTADVPANEVDEQNDVYVANVTEAGGEKQTTIAQFAPEAGGAPGSLIQRFTAPGLLDGQGLAVNDLTGAVYVTDATSDRLDVFELEPGGPPSIEGLQVQGAATPAPDSRRLVALLDPLGLATRYHFEYGTTSCAAYTGACTATPTREAPAAFGGVEVSQEVDGLPPGAYHFRVLAENEAGAGESTEATFTVLQVKDALPDNRAWEMVSPPNTYGASIEPLNEVGGVILASEDGDALTYFAVGGAPSQNAEGNGAPEPQQLLSLRGTGEWTTQDLATPDSDEKSAIPGRPPEYEAFSPDLSLALLTPYYAPVTEAPPLLAPGVTEEEAYLRDDQPLAPEAPERQSYEEAEANSAFLAPGFLPLFASGDDKEQAFEGATPDLSHIVFYSPLPLTGPESGPGLYERSVGGGLTYVSELPDAEGPAAGRLGGAGQIVSHAISDDGSRVIWSASAHGGLHLYMTDTATTPVQTIQLDAAQGVAEPEDAGAVFQTASSDASSVLFTDKQILTKGSSANGQNDADLYDCEVTEAHGQLGCDLRDLTGAVAKTGEHAAVQGLLLGAGEDGHSAYLVAHGVLADNENANRETPQAGQDNLYALRWAPGSWVVTFIATLSSADAAGWGNSEVWQVRLDARVSPNGRYLAFMSERELTGYDNVDLNPAAQGAHDEEVFLYDSASHSLACVSCDPTGARPRGVYDSPNGGEGYGLLVDRPGTWRQGGHWLAGAIPGWTAHTASTAFTQSRYLSDEGRLFFDSADPLVPGIAAPTRSEPAVEQLGACPGATPSACEVGVENVYEYEPPGTGSCEGSSACLALLSSGTSEHESAFMEATPDGDDVFFLTAAQLTPQDIEGSFTVYDARVCTPSSPCLTPPTPPPPACASAEACHPGLSGEQGPLGSLGTAAFSGPGNLTPPVQPKGEVKAQKSTVKPPTRAQKLSKALAACRKRYPRSKRRRGACEAHARKLYAPKPKKTEKATRKDKR